MARSSARSRGSVGALLVTLALGSAVACSTTTDPEGAAVTDAGVQGERGPEVLATCTDGAKNGSETDVDCGGSCPKCVTGKACGSATDCVTASCTAGVCAAQPPSCSDGTKNASETDVDCGGACPKCANGKACGGATDCASGTCARGVCGVLPPSCTDGAKNGTEADVDCGGSCPKCGSGKACGGPADCVTATCTAGVCVVAPRCDDGVKNGNETDVDCGGPCPACANGKRCGGPPDCQSATCTGGACGPPSCAAGLTCQGRDCCESLVVPGGTFPMGRSEAGTDACPPATFCASDDQPEHAVTVSSFVLDTFEVTVGRFRAFVDAYGGPPAAGAGAHPLIAGTGWDAAWNGSTPASAAALRSNLKCNLTYQTWSDAPGPIEAKPINCVSWYEAFAFCAWDGGWLPTEAEAEYASAGGDENRLYPWGSAAPTPSLASYGCLFDGGASCEAADLPIVGSTPAGNGRWGHRDLSGSLREWSYDWYDASWYSGAGAFCTDCANSSPASSRAARSSAFLSSVVSLRAAVREAGVPGFRYPYLGFRCGRTP